MNIVYLFTLRHLKQNKKRTLVTIIGVIISVAMVTAVSMLAFSFLGLMRGQSIVSNGKIFYLLMAIIMIVILIGSIFLIYNAFGISVSERTRDLGMLSSVGATSKQKRNSVYFEGVIIGGISIPLGIICGYMGTAAIIWFLNGRIESLLRTTAKATVTLTPLSILIPVVVSMIIIIISTYPAQKASSISAIDAIRQTADIKLTGKTVRTSRFIRKFFGIAAEIGLKNLKRNKRRYHGTVFSLIISIVLFLVVSFFTTNLANLFKLSQNGVDYDIQVSMNNNESKFVKSIVSLEDITNYNLVSESMQWSTEIKKSSFSPIVQQLLNNNSFWMGSNDEQYRLPVIIEALTDKMLEAYAKEVGADYRQLQDLDNPSAIVLNVIGYPSAGTSSSSFKWLKSKIFNEKTKETIDLKYGFNEEKNVPFKIAALTEKPPEGVILFQSSATITIVVSKQVLDQYHDPYLNHQLYLWTKDSLKTVQEIKGIDHNLFVLEYSVRRQRDNWILLIIKLFGFGFVALITAISMANIFNMISTSISLRRREFAMLRSMGMEPRSFNKMIYYESIFYGITSLTYGLPISVMIMYVMYRGTIAGYLNKWTFGILINRSFRYGFILPWTSIFVAIAAVFTIVCLTMLYASAKVQKNNIIDALKQENI